MQKIISPNPTTGSPFFDLLAEAEEVKIREIPAEKDSAPQDGDTRTFLVRIKQTPPPPVPAPAPRAEEKPAPRVEEKPAPETPDNRNYLLKSAELLLADQDFILARNIYSYLLKLDIRDIASMKGLGTCFLKLRDTNSAKKCFRALLELSPNQEPRLWIANCLIAEGNELAALEEFKKIENPSALSPEDQFEYYRERGNCETRAQKFEAAWAHYHQALKLNPQADAIHVNLGTLELQRQHADVSLSYFQMALKLNPSNARAHCGIGLVAVTKQDLVTAKSEFEATLELDSQNLVALFQLIHLSAEEEQTTAVKARIHTFLQKDPRQADVRYALAVLLFRDGDWTGCEQEISALLAAHPQHVKAKALRDQLMSHKHLPA